MPYHILLVDDDPYFRSEFREVMEEFDIIEAADGEEMLKILKKPHNIDLIILDQMMPGMKGTDLLREIQDTTPNIRIVLLTGQASQEVAIESLRGHATDFIEKPLNAQKLEKLKELVLSSPKGEKDKNTGGVIGKIEQAKYFAQRNYDKKLTLEDVANAVCLSPKYLSRLFKEHTSTRFSDYKLKIRMERAKELLRNKGDNIEEIAYRLGYQNSESFIKVFHKFNNCTPKHYRERAFLKEVKKHTDSSFLKKTRKSIGLQLTPRMLARSKNAIFTMDKKGRILRWTKSAQNMYGWKENEVFEKKVRSIVPKNESKQFLSSLKRMQEGGVVESFETKRITKEGHALNVWAIKIPMHDSQGRVESIIVIDQNLTPHLKKLRQLQTEKQQLLNEHKRLKHQRESIAKEAQIKTETLIKTQEDLDKEKHFSDLGRLAAVVAHELRHPLCVIQAAAWNIGRKNKNHRLDHNINSIEKMVAEGEGIINNLLEYSRIRNPIYQTVKIKNFIAEFVDTIKIRFDKNRMNIIKNTKEIIGISIPIDPQQIREVLTNVLTNAYEAIPEKKKGKVNIKASVENNSLVIKVADNGQGIKPEDQEKIFEPFFSGKHTGTGLGLTVAHEIIKGHHGSIAIDSQLHKGATVTIKLPLQQSASISS